MPVSLQHEVDYLDYYGYYGYPYCWDSGGMWGAGLYPYNMKPDYGAYGPGTSSDDSELAAYLPAWTCTQIPFITAASLWP